MQRVTNQRVQKITRLWCLQLQASALGQARTLSSHCSGFGSAEIALAFLKVGLAFAGWHGLAICSSSACAGSSVI